MPIKIMNSTDTMDLSQVDKLTTCYNLWQPIVIIVLQVLGLGVSSIKYYLGNKHHTSLLDSIKKVFNNNVNLPTEQVQLNIPEHLASSVQKDKDAK